jgi:sigma-E factor negative regulatory protein RseC
LGCGVSVVFNLFPAQTHRLQVCDEIGVEVGDSVVIGIADAALTRASLLAYLLPLIVLVFVVYGAQTAGVGEGLSALVGLLGLCLGLWITGRLTGTSAGQEAHRPVLLRRSELGAGTILSVVRCLSDHQSISRVETRRSPSGLECEVAQP